MTMAHLTQLPQTPPPTNHDFRRFHGTLAQIEAQLCVETFPDSWGPSSAIRLLIAYHVPIGPGWRGELVVMGHRTTPNETSTGTAQLSVTWKPLGRGQHFDVAE